MVGCSRRGPPRTPPARIISAESPFLPHSLSLRVLSCLGAGAGMVEPKPGLQVETPLPFSQKAFYLWNRAALMALDPEKVDYLLGEFG